MREIRIFEMEQNEPAAAWRVERAVVLKVISGEIWLTLHGDAEDYWLRAGESYELPRGALARLSAGRERARVAVADSQCRTLPPAALRPLIRWLGRTRLPRWLAAA
jgi:quercetin dioxygenase-like cupin family protein